VTATASSVPQPAVNPDVVGYVEAATDTRILGWAWAPRKPQERLVVQALLDEAVVAEGSADRSRDDLARNGIGDGQHAFELALPESARPRLAELRVVARAEDGAAIPLGAPALQEGTAERLDRLQRGLDMLIGSQRVLHRNLQAAMLAPRRVPEDRAANDASITGTEIGATQAELGRQIATLEVFAMRLEEWLAALVPAVTPTSARASPATLVALVLSVLALAGSAWGLLHSLPGPVTG